MKTNKTAGRFGCQSPDLPNKLIAAGSASEGKIFVTKIPCSRCGLRPANTVAGL